MHISHEDLSWELLDFWRSSGMPPCTTERAPIVVARGDDGMIHGFAAVGNGELDVPDCVVVEPVVATSLHVGLSVMDAMEKYLRDAGYASYLFFTDGSSLPGFEEQVRRCGVFTELGVSEGACWFRRDLTVQNV